MANGLDLNTLAELLEISCEIITTSKNPMERIEAIESHRKHAIMYNDLFNACFNGTPKIRGDRGWEPIYDEEFRG